MTSDISESKKVSISLWIDEMEERDVPTLFRLVINLNQRFNFRVGDPLELLEDSESVEAPISVEDLLTEAGMLTTEFEEELSALLNKHSAENGSDTPDFILAKYLQSSLNAFNMATKQRTFWYRKSEE